MDHTSLFLRRVAGCDRIVPFEKRQTLPLAMMFFNYYQYQPATVAEHMLRITRPTKLLMLLYMAIRIS